MSKQFSLTLTDGLNDKTIFFDIIDNSVAHKWATEIENNYPLYENKRFTNWPGKNDNDLNFIKKLNERINIVNNYSPGTISINVQNPVHQEDLNNLHKFFEILRGPVNEGTDFYNSAPEHVKRAICEFNIIIHEYEHYQFNKSVIDLTKHPYATIVCTYSDRPRYPLEEQEFDLYTFKWEYGNVYVNYCEVGKPILDVFKDQDEVVGDENIRPLKYYSADFQIKFGPSTTESTYIERLALFDQWWESKKMYFDSIGLEKNNKLALGLIPVAKFNKIDSGFADKTDVEIVNLLSPYQEIKETGICIK